MLLYESPNTNDIIINMEYLIDSIKVGGINISTLIDDIGLLKLGVEDFIQSNINIKETNKSNLMFDFGKYSKYVSINQISLFLLTETYVVNDTLESKHNITIPFTDYLISLIKGHIKSVSFKHYDLNDITITTVDIDLIDILNGSKVFDKLVNPIILYTSIKSIFTKKSDYIKSLFDEAVSKWKSDDNGYLYINLVYNNKSLRFDLIDAINCYKYIYNYLTDNYGIEYLHKRVFVTDNKESKFHLSNISNTILSALRYIEYYNTFCKEILFVDNKSDINSVIYNNKFKSMLTSPCVITSLVPISELLVLKSFNNKVADKSFYPIETIVTDKGIGLSCITRFDNKSVTIDTGFKYYEGYSIFTNKKTYSEIEGLSSNDLNNPAYYELTKRDTYYAPMYMKKSGISIYNEARDRNDMLDFLIDRFFNSEIFISLDDIPNFKYYLDSSNKVSYYLPKLIPKYISYLKYKGVSIR